MLNQNSNRFLFIVRGRGHIKKMIGGFFMTFLPIDSETKNESNVAFEYQTNEWEKFHDISSNRFANQK